MTRINLVPVEELSDQHLFAEWREIKMVPSALRRALKTKPWDKVKAGIPEKFCLGTGHVKFFFDKMSYLETRYNRLTIELVKRGYTLGPTTFDMRDLPRSCWVKTYSPTAEDLVLIRSRIQEKINMKPEWYRWSKYT